jgi:excisionase family DNA binding protein
MSIHSLTGPPLLTVDDLATRWAVSATTIRRMERRGELESCRIRGLVRFRAEVIARFEKKKRKGA